MSDYNQNDEINDDQRAGSLYSGGNSNIKNEGTDIQFNNTLDLNDNYNDNDNDDEITPDVISNENNNQKNNEGSLCEQNKVEEYYVEEKKAAKEGKNENDKKRKKEKNLNKKDNNKKSNSNKILLSYELPKNKKLIGKKRKKNRRFSKRLYKKRLKSFDNNTFNERNTHSTTISNDDPWNLKLPDYCPDRNLNNIFVGNPDPEEDNYNFDIINAINDNQSLNTIYR